MDLRRFALQIRLRSRMKRIPIDAVQACGMFIKSYPYLKGKIVDGYCISSSEIFKHYWVESDDGKTFDIAYELAKIENPSIENISFKITKEKPEGNIQTDEHNEELFKLYLEEPKKYWQLVQKSR